jgi:hypothetical protein
MPTSTEDMAPSVEDAPIFETLSEDIASEYSEEE